MTESLALLLFLFLNVFLMGVLTAIAIRHARAHFWPQHHEPERPHVRPQTVHLPPAVKDHLLQASQANFQHVLEHAATELQRELKATAQQLNKQLAHLGDEIVSDELQQYRASMDQLRTHAEAAMNNSQNTIAEHEADLKAKLAERQAELEAKLQEELAAEKQHLLQLMDTRLADAVASFLTETLQHDIDLGAQSKYLTAMLEEHKAEIAKGVSHEA